MHLEHTARIVCVLFEGRNGYRTSWQPEGPKREYLAPCSHQCVFHDRTTWWFANINRAVFLKLGDRLKKTRFSGESVADLELAFLQKYPDGTVLSFGEED